MCATLMFVQEWVITGYRGTVPWPETMVRLARKSLLSQEACCAICRGVRGYGQYAVPIDVSHLVSMLQPILVANVVLQNTKRIDPEVLYLEATTNEYGVCNRLSKASVLFIKNE